MTSAILSGSCPLAQGWCNIAAAFVSLKGGPAVDNPLLWVVAVVFIVCVLWMAWVDNSDPWDGDRL